MKRKIVKGILLIVAIFLVVFIGLVVSSMIYDRSDPRALPNAYRSADMVIIDRPVSEVFRFIQYEIPSVYTQLSPMHEKFEIVLHGQK